MKILKNVLSIFVFSLLLTSIAYSQSADVTASATVINDVTVVNGKDLTFGNILATQTVTIAANNADAGRVDITNAVDGVEMGITVTFPNELVAINSGTGGPLTFDTYTAATKVNSTDPTSGTAPLTGGSGQEITGTLTTSTDPMYVFVGGRVNGATGDAGVTYEGTITVTVDYP